MDLAVMMRRLRVRLLQRRADVDDVDDLIHDALLKLIQYQNRGHEVHTPEAFLHATATNLFIDQARKRQRLQIDLVDDIHIREFVGLQPNPADIAELHARLVHLQAGLECLHEKTRRIILARRLDGLSVTEIAHRERMTVAAVEKQIARGTYRLLQWMEDW